MTIERLPECPAGPFDAPDGVPVEQLADDELEREVCRLARLRAQVDARSAAAVAEADRRGVPQIRGFGSPTAWLVALTGDPAAVCRSRLRVARALRHMEHTRQAFTAGCLSECRVRLLADAWEQSGDLFRRDEALLVAQARHLSARVFPLALTHWRRLADPDGARADAGRAFQRRRLHVSATWAGMVRLDGDLDPESGMLVLTAIRSLAEPAALQPDDTRSPQQRRADALVEICRRHLDSPHRPQQAGERPHLVVTVDLATLQGQAEQLVDLETGPITLEAVRRLACDASLTRVIMGPGSEPLAVGHRSRVIPASLRRALNLRDQGCTHPGCDVPARWTDAHHIHHWAQGGPTTLPNPSS